MSRPNVRLLTRAGCTICGDGLHAQLTQLAAKLAFDLDTSDVDAHVQCGDTALWAEFGDRLPVVLLDGRERSYKELNEPRLRGAGPADLTWAPPATLKTLKTCS